MLLVSSRIFERRRASCFTNLDLKDFLEENGAKSIEFIGVDGNVCVKASVLAATKEGELSGFWSSGKIAESRLDSFMGILIWKLFLSVTGSQITVS